ncbi:TLD-domain-containing protein [Neocallimastix lanati (nom. inval.)]|jgi:hypothetical protein|uniref:Oxidation resistance protein 1 n=1 Tax=Neocallimastix californiae TaxID=1754190 RepID=A0A1Y2CVV2_9FUNG|nr:TLD-domain-containing protein [Neocallimastix sp. JGI-2020a]ORY51168.1 TLD-domain-containing protein [Neocallimastix californiae]|eukprot:ORY51168.1 TLD-domain-containing protein [Neocallimastix californiae]
MGLITIVKHQRKKWSKNEDCKSNIDLPNGVTLKGQKKKRKILPNFFSSIFKSKYNAAIAATKKNNSDLCEKLNKLEINDEVVNIKPSSSIRFAGIYDTPEKKCKGSVTSKLLQVFDPEKTIQHDDLYDSEKTVQRNDITYLKFPESEISDEYESTVGTVVSDECSSPTQSYLTRKTIHLNGREESTLPVLTEYLAEIIRSRLPKLLQEATTWNLLYSMDQHGARLSTLYRLIKDQGPCVVVLKNSENEVFGAFISEPFDPSNHGFFGSPECFLWKSNNYQFKKFAATRNNQYFMLADPTFIAMGGGNGNFGFYLDEDIQFGYSSVCDTYNNEILTEDNEFECYGCEIWGLEF